MSKQLHSNTSVPGTIYMYIHIFLFPKASQQVCQIGSIRFQLTNEELLSHTASSWQSPSTTIFIFNDLPVLSLRCPRGIWVDLSISHVRGGHWEDVTASWPLSWTQKIGGSSPPTLSLERAFSHHPHSRSHIQGHSPERERVVETIWTVQWLNPVKTSVNWRFWPAGAEICLSCECKRQASCVNSLAY